MNYNFTKNEFKKEHKIIDDEYYLNLYLNLVIGYGKVNEEYSENHHILPRSSFPEYENESWNIVNLNYDDHKLAHLYLFKAINDRRYQKPLNFMLNYEKVETELSNAAKRGWTKLKNNEDNYNKWKQKRSNYMKKLSSKEQRRRAKIFWNNLTEKEYEEFCNKIKDYWTEENRLKKSIQMNEYYSNDGNVEKKRIETKERWDSLSEKDRIKFREKMNLINKDPEKRKDAGEKIKKLWKNDEYLEKMKNRKRKEGKKIIIIHPDGEKILFEYISDVVRTYNVSLYIIRKYLDSGNKIPEKYSNKDLIGCLIKSK